MDSNPLPRNIAELAAKVNAALYATFAYWEPRVQSSARSNARWTDRTGNARQGLFAKHTSGRARQRITVYHTMPYGVWLEVSHDGRYQIIIPTVRTMGPQVMKSASGIIGRLT
jgi:hypothetical protein